MKMLRHLYLPTHCDKLVSVDKAGLCSSLESGFFEALRLDVILLIPVGSLDLRSSKRIQQTN